MRRDLATADAPGPTFRRLLSRTLSYKQKNTQCHWFTHINPSSFIIIIIDNDDDCLLDVNMTDYQCCKVVL